MWCWLIIIALVLVVIVGAWLLFDKSGRRSPMRLLLALLLLLPGTTAAQTIISRRYWIIPLDTLAIGHLKHTHVETTGRVKYCVWEDDGDRHIRLLSVFRLDALGRRRVDSLAIATVLYSDSTKFITIEWIPELTLLTCPPKGSVITVRGITRMDPEHLWPELHPILSWTYFTLKEE